MLQKYRIEITASNPKVIDALVDKKGRADFRRIIPLPHPFDTCEEYMKWTRENWGSYGNARFGRLSQGQVAIFTTLEIPEGLFDKLAEMFPNYSFQVDCYIGTSYFMDSQFEASDGQCFQSDDGEIENCQYEDDWSRVDSLYRRNQTTLEKWSEDEDWKSVAPQEEEPAPVYDDVAKVLRFERLPSGNYKVVGIRSSIESYEIPSEYKGHPITSIENSAFAGRIKLIHLTIPDSVTRIGESAFSSRTSLESVTLPNKLRQIGFHTFYGCVRLQSIMIPESVSSIGYEAFHGCKCLTSIIIPKKVRTIEDRAFKDCSSLEHVVIGCGVTFIGKGVFSGCDKLRNITYQGTIAEWAAIDKTDMGYLAIYRFNVHCTDGDIVLR